MNERVEPTRVFQKKKPWKKTWWAMAIFIFLFPVSLPALAITAIYERPRLRAQSKYFATLGMVTLTFVIAWNVTIIANRNNPAFQTSAPKWAPKQSVAAVQTKKWVIVRQHVAADSAVTDPFKLVKARTRISYVVYRTITHKLEGPGDPMGFELYVVEKGKEANGEPVVKLSASDTGDLMVNKPPGEYYVQIKGFNTNYTVTVEQEIENKTTTTTLPLK
ncbi:MAG: hypothetical protein ACYC1U_01200 [Candidatus Aquicultorales bacterium]